MILKSVSVSVYLTLNDHIFGSKIKKQSDQVIPMGIIAYENTSRNIITFTRTSVDGHPSPQKVPKVERPVKSLGCKLEKVEGTSNGSSPVHADEK